MSGGEPLLRGFIYCFLFDLFGALFCFRGGFFTAILDGFRGFRGALFYRTRAFLGTLFNGARGRFSGALYILSGVVRIHGYRDRAGKKERKWQYWKFHGFIASHLNASREGYGAQADRGACTCEKRFSSSSSKEKSGRGNPRFFK